MYSPIFQTIFLIGLCVSGVVVWFFARRHPNPRFRPRAGEVVLMAMLGVGISAGASVLLTRMFDSENELLTKNVKDFEAKKPERRQADDAAAVGNAPGPVTRPGQPGAAGSARYQVQQRGQQQQQQRRGWGAAPEWREVDEGAKFDNRNWNKAKGPE
ncbi:MAG: hypothetical protein ACC661_06705 [Verrucomicrobiales bacterium]